MSPPETIQVNGRAYAWPTRPVVVLCIDGSEPGYIEAAAEAGVAITLLAIALDRGGIFYAPMRGERLAWPYRTALARCVVADGEDEIELGCAGLGELAPVLRVQAIGRIAEALQHIERHRMHLALGLATRAVGTKTTSAHFVHQRFAQDRAG